MDFTPDTSPSHYQIRSYERGKIIINDQAITQNLIISASQLIYPWDENNLEPILELKPVIVLLGTGEKFKIIPPQILSPFYKNKIGVEVMNTSAACRTFNVLAAEGRNVVAGLII
ncbi:MAG TPA: MTH938/NDUFAF3 family protein [Gammaproteobacteria bacterium]|nr:MTH938/NDUFAF3 family protein [Gammaproteobacteria bacterium]